MNSSSPTDPLAPAAGTVLGIVLVVLGIGAYALTDFASVTALIPAIFGVVIAALGAVGRRADPGRRRLAGYGIGLLALLAIGGSARGVPDLLALVTGDAVDSVVATVSQGLMIVISVLLLLAVVKDVLDER